MLAIIFEGNSSQFWHIIVLPFCMWTKVCRKYRNGQCKRNGNELWPKQHLLVPKFTLIVEMSLRHRIMKYFCYCYTDADPKCKTKVVNYNFKRVLQHPLIDVYRLEFVFSLLKICFSLQWDSFIALLKTSTSK